MKLILDAAALARFEPRINKTASCWLWDGTKDSHGYGVFWRNRKSVKARRVSYLLYNNSIDETLTIDHLCRVRNCVNPEHLEQVSLVENGIRSAEYNHNRLVTHCKNGHPLSGENLYQFPNHNKRGCRICRKAALGRRK